MNRVPISFKNTKKDQKLYDFIMKIENKEKSYQIKKILYQYFFKEEY